MRVLFAVSNENITVSVVNKYQQKYKEIITSKNVYYFNAIIKELQNDKSYDAIVISEDLEPVANNNYEAVDKFLIDRLDSISDEASKPTGEDIPIIFICSDRRTKSDQLLRKLFSMSIYNALIGNDRSVNVVCNLINKPRGKKEAKKYYQIDSEQIEYEPENDELVSETQIQNILSYYKKIGSNEKKCVEAFDSITKQYDETQLRVIVKVLPIQVKAILEEKSEKYQRLMSGGTVLSTGKYKKYDDKATSDKKLTGIDILEKDLGKSKIKGNVVIPSTINIKNTKNVTPVNPYQGAQTSNTNSVRPNPINRPMMNNTTNMNQMNTNNVNNMWNNTPFDNPYEAMNQTQPNGQYTNQQNINSSVNQNVNQINQINQHEEEFKKVDNMETNQTNNNLVVEPVKRGRGRPKKVQEAPSTAQNAVAPQPQINNVGINTANTTSQATHQSVNNTVEPKKTRGRPRKVVTPQPVPAQNSVNESTSGIAENVQPVQNNIPQQDTITSGYEGELNKQFGSDSNFNTNSNDIYNNQYNPSFVPMDNFGLQNQAPYQDPYNNMNSMNTNINPYDNNMGATNTSINPYDNNMGATNTNINPYDNNMGAMNEGINQNFYGSNNFNNANAQQGFMQDIIPSMQDSTFQNPTQNNISSGKIAAFVGTSKNGTSFIVNNLAEIISQNNIKVAILDLTENNNAYYMFTNNEQRLMQIATESIKNLSKGIVKGVEVNKNLSVFTSLPDEIKTEKANINMVIDTLSKNFDITLIDCDFKTEKQYFAMANEIYLIQSMDAFTIQPLTKFLSDLKLQNMLDESKIRIVINKYVKLKRLDYKLIIGGMSKYNEPSMTLQRDLFNPDRVQSITIPFDEQTYANYLEEIAMCQLSVNGYSQEFMRSLNELKNMVCPLISGGTKKDQTSSPKYGNYESNKKQKKGIFSSKKSNTEFSNNVNDTLSKMRNTNY